MSNIPLPPSAPVAPVAMSEPDLPEIKSVAKVGNKAGKEVNMSQLAHLMGVTPRTVKNWVMDGMPCLEQEHGKAWLFDSSACFAWRIEKAEQDIQRQYAHLENPEQLSTNQIKRRTAEAAMHREELKLEKEAGEVAFIEDMMVNFSAVLGEVRAKLVSLSSRRSGMLSHQEQEDVEKILEEEVQEILEALTSYEHSYIERD